MPAQPRWCGLPLGFAEARGGPNTFDGTSGGPKTDGLPTSPIRPESPDPPDPEPGAEFISGGPWGLHTCPLTQEPSHDRLKPVRGDNPPTATEKPMTKIFGGQTEFTEGNMDTNPWASLILDYRRDPALSDTGPFVHFKTLTGPERRISALFHSKHLGISIWKRNPTSGEGELVAYHWNEEGQLPIKTVSLPTSIDDALKMLGTACQTDQIPSFKQSQDDDKVFHLDGTPYLFDRWGTGGFEAEKRSGSRLGIFYHTVNFNFFGKEGETAESGQTAATGKSLATVDE